MTTKDEIFESLVSAMGENHNIAPDAIQWERPFNEVGLDSLDIIDMIQIMEEDLDMHIHYDRIKQELTPQELVDLVHSHFYRQQ